MSAETEDILVKFTELLTGPTGDGSNKRAAGTKEHWTVDDTHYDAMLRHLGRYWNGERVDADSGCHPLVHLAWRALALAYQQTQTHKETQIPGQERFWQEVAGGIFDPAETPAVFINHDPRPLPRYTCATVRDGVN